jgi:hypothetical protein
MLDCPGLLRLREVHMSSVPFMLFPSFSSVNRFEHSLGVCHLAQIASDALELSKRDKVELMCAGLYHDVATPPFGHVTEELLHDAFGFNHENHLTNLLVGKSDDLAMEKIQIYKGKGLKLLEIIHSKEGQRLDLDIFRIADMAVGKGRLGPLVKGEIDLDNIDNVIRAATAMGIKYTGGNDAEILANLFQLTPNGLSFNEVCLPYLQKWQQTRYELYDKIYGDVEDFSLQTMLTIAIKLLLKSGESTSFLRFDWKLTDDELYRERIMYNPKAREIWDRISLFKPYPCVGIISVFGRDANSFLRNNLERIETLGTDCFNQTCFANINVDKRNRALTYPLTNLWGHQENVRSYDNQERAFLFLFSPRKAKNQKECYQKFTSSLQSSLPIDINLRTVRRINDKYPHLMEDTNCT